MTDQNQTVSGMPGRYATALFELAEEANAIDQVAEDLGNFSQLLDQSEDLTRLVRSPIFGADEQLRATTAVMDRAGIKGLAANFIQLVARNRRLFAIADMVKGYRELVAAARGEITAEVTSADELTAAQLKKLKDVLKASQGRDVQLESSVDPSLLGGLVVKVGSRMVDNSLRTKLQNLKTAMKGA